MTLEQGARVAVYYAPADDDPLHAAGSSWLGRDAISGAALAQPDVPGIAAITADARGYGFHATLKPPFHPRPGVTWEEVKAAAAETASMLPAFDLPPLRLSDLDGFLALTEAAPCPALQALCDACVAGLDHLRAPSTDAELARRRAGGLTQAQDAALRRWGYPYVFGTWFFHMTLTRRLSAAEAAAIRPDVEAHMDAALAAPRRVTHVCLFVQPAPGAPFGLRQRVALAA